MTRSFWQTSRFKINLQEPKVMGIVNVTPDSFSESGDHGSLSQALQYAQLQLAHGADMLDVGGESSRPGASPVSLEEELGRVLPFLKEAITWGVPISVDTCKPEVMKAALEIGADIINDIGALRQPGALEVIRDHGRCGVCLMHMHRDPQTMQKQPMLGDVLNEVTDFLSAQIVRLRDGGVQSDRIVLDPGIGFGKTDDQNLTLLRHQKSLLALGQPLLAGWSRKSTLGNLSRIQNEVPDAKHRLGASVAAALMAVQMGASVVRVHDVCETVQALRVWRAVKA